MNMRGGGGESVKTTKGSGCGQGGGGREIQQTLNRASLGSLGTLQVALAFINQDGVSLIEGYESRKSYGK